MQHLVSPWKQLSSIIAATPKSPIYLIVEPIIHVAQAVSTQAPPASLILFSASLEKTLALTMNGTLGRAPLPSTLK